RVRDAALRAIARRRGIVVASMVADVRVDEEPTAKAETDAETAPERELVSA
ncbi:MAG: hypothetical protein V7636_254, partial [Actinomycetota bacterium]